MQVQGFMVEAGGRLGSAAKNVIDDVVVKCEMSEVALTVLLAAAFLAIGIEVMHKRQCP